MSWSGGMSRGSGVRSGHPPPPPGTPGQQYPIMGAQLYSIVGSFWRSYLIPQYPIGDHFEDPWTRIPYRGDHISTILNWVSP